MTNLENTIDRIQELIDSDAEPQLRDELNSYHSADLADIFAQLKPEERLECFKLLNIEKAADLMEYLSPQLQVELLGELDEELASKIITKLPHDAAADVLGDMEEDESEMTVTVDMTVQDVLNTIRSKAEKDNFELYYIYVVDKQNHLLGVISLRKLLTSPANQPVKEIMIRDIVKLHVDDYSDFIVDEFLKYQYNALPVVDLYNRLKGMVTWDDVHDLFEEETTEEIYQSSGISTEIVDEDQILSGNVLNAIIARLPWLFITLIGEFLAVNVANHFNATLTALPIIAIFMPLLAGLGGNIGTQSITLMVRGLSTGQVTLNSALFHIFREMGIGLMIGTIFGLLVTLTTWGWQHNIELGIIVGIAMIINMTMATVIGTFTPFALKSMNVDPAIASGPIIATTIDVIGLAIYFGLVSAFLISHSS